MKRIGLVLIVFCLGLLAASFAFADDGGKGKGKSSDAQGNAQKCHNISLKGTAPATSFTVTVDKANKPGRDLKTATVTFSGKVSINAQLCSAGDASGSAAPSSTLKLRNLKVGKASSED
jgi:hypothetical protein